MAAERKIKLGRRTRQNNPVRSQRKKPESLSASVCLGAKLCLLETSATGTRWRFGSFGNHLYFSLAFQMSMCQRYQRCRRRCFVGAVPIWTNTYKPSSSATELPCAWARYGHVNTDAFSTRRCAWSCKDIKMISPGPLDEFVISICARSCTNYCWVFTKIPTNFFDAEI